MTTPFISPHLQDLWEQHVSQHYPPPEILYHYTTVDGLLGINQSQGLFATDIWYLNDSHEMAHPMSAAYGYLEQYANSFTDEGMRVQLKSLQHAFEEFISPRTFVVSFSANGDQLSQWRGYCRDSAGFSLGFRSDSLVTVGGRCGFHLVKCIYDDATHREIIEAIVHGAADRLSALPQPPSQENLTALKLAFLRDLLVFAPILKNPGFQEEAEWRLVCFDLRESRTPAFRGGRHTLIPYTLFPLQVEERQAEIDEMIIGPAPHLGLSAIAAEDLAKAYCVPVRRVRASAIPYRQV